MPSPAAAQVGAAVSIFNDDRFRGYSLSDGRPVAVFDLSYDAPDGLYAALSASMVATRRDGLQPLGLLLNGGYAKRLPHGLTLDFGVIHSRYSTYVSRPGKHYTEAYAGLGGKFLSARFSISPDYLKYGLWTAYGELDGTVPAGRKLRFTGHLGMLVPFEKRLDYETYRPEFDWRLGIARVAGPVTLSVAWTGRERAREPYQERSYGRSALILGVTYVP